MPQIGEPFIPQSEFTRKGNGYIGPIIPIILLMYPMLNAASKVIWAVLAARAGKDGNCFPSYDDIAKQAGLSRREVPNCLKHLKEGGFIEWDRGGPQKSNCYRLLWHPIFEEARLAERRKAAIRQANREVLSRITGSA